VACWSTKAAICLKRAKIVEKLLWKAYRTSPTLFRTVPFPTHAPLLFLDWGFATPPAIISGMGKATDLKFGQYIHRVHPKRSPLNILKKRERGRIQRLPNFGGSPIISGTTKATNFPFCAHIYRLNRNKSPLKISGKVAVRVVRDSRNFSGHTCRSIGRIARSSLR